LKFAMTEIQHSQTAQRRTGNSAPYDAGRRPDAIAKHGAVPSRPVAVDLVDARGCPLSGATTGALEAYETALAAFQTWRTGAELPLAEALREAPRFVMAHALQAYLLVCSRDPRRVRSAHLVLARIAGLPCNRFEQQHLAALGAVLDDDYELAKSHLGKLLREQPREALALQVAHALDYLTGDLAHMHDRVAAVLPAWSSDVPGYGAVLAMYAFSLEECGEYHRAEHIARAALSLNPLNARAHHVMAHLFEMTERPGAGVRWMGQHTAGWDLNSVVATHCCWHLALFHLAQGRIDRALDLYDRRIGAGHTTEVADLIDASALLWRIDLRGGDAGERWSALASAWSPHVEDGFCSFNDIHAMLAFVGARDWNNAARLELALARSGLKPTRHGLTTRQLGLTACRALVAFGRGDAALAAALLASLPVSAHRLGGSHAQRDVLHLTMQHALERVRRPSRLEPVPTAASAVRPRHRYAGVRSCTSTFASMLGQRGPGRPSCAASPSSEATVAPAN
jgi:tetratricopeptide (TPR) repeat protein